MYIMNSSIQERGRKLTVLCTWIISSIVFCLLTRIARENENLNNLAISDHSNSTLTYNILCSSTAFLRSWGSYRARCIQFKSWLDTTRCAPSVNIVLGELPPESNSSIQYNATMYVKWVPPVQANLGRTFVDVVDQFMISGRSIPMDFEVIVQGMIHGTERFPNHKSHAIEHWYSSYPLDMNNIDPEYVPEIVEKDILQVGTVCAGCPMPTNGNLSSVNMVMIDEAKEGGIEQWFVKYLSGDGWTEEKMSKMIEDPRYGKERLYTAVFQMFDVLIITPKKDRNKLRYGSIQRITSQMRSGTPVLVRAEGLAFISFVEYHNYSCVYSDNTYSGYQTLEQALVLMKDVNYRKKCQNEGLKISLDFSPNVIGKELLRVLGYNESFNC